MALSAPPRIRITHLSGMLPLACGFNVNNGRELCSLANRSNLAMNRRPRAASLHIAPLFLGIPVKARYRLAKWPPRRSRRPSHSVKRPDCLRRLAPQPRFVAAHAVKQGRGKIGETQETLAGAWISTAVLCWWSDRRARSGQRLSCGHWSEHGFAALPVDRVCGRESAGVRAEIRLASQTGRFRWHWHDEVATTGLLVDERAQAPARIADQHCR